MVLSGACHVLPSLMYFDLNFLVPPTGPANKGKGKQSQPILYSQTQIEAIEARIDLLVHCTRALVATVKKHADRKASGLLRSCL